MEDQNPTTIKGRGPIKEKIWVGIIAILIIIMGISIYSFYEKSSNNTEIFKDVDTKDVAVSKTEQGAGENKNASVSTNSTNEEIASQVEINYDASLPSSVDENINTSLSNNKNTVTNTETSISAEIEDNPFLNWIMYTNPQFPYTMKYSPEWYLSEKNSPFPNETYDDVIFTGKDRNMTVRIKARTIVDLESDEETFERTERWKISDLEREQKIISGQPAMYYKDVPTLPKSNAVLIRHNGILYIISKWYINDTDFNNVLSTFTFTK